MNSQNDSILITKHAYSRLKKRNGWSRRTAERMIPRIYSDGLRPSQVKGYLKTWINTKYDYSNDGDEYILFGEKLYIFNGMAMLTVLPVPSRSNLIRET